MTMTKEEAQAALIAGKPLEAWDAAKHLRKHVAKDDLGFLISAWTNVNDYLLRLEVVDMIGQSASKEACAFLLGVARGKDYHLVRYYALRNAIELGCGDWQPKSKRALSSDFYASLLAYERYLSQEIDLETLRTMALDRSKRSGDHWDWLTQPVAKPTIGPFSGRKLRTRK
jgi:hypothetical protein